MLVRSIDRTWGPAAVISGARWGAVAEGGLGVRLGNCGDARPDRLHAALSDNDRTDALIVRNKRPARVRVRSEAE